MKLTNELNLHDSERRVLDELAAVRIVGQPSEFIYLVEGEFPDNNMRFYRIK